MMCSILVADSNRSRSCLFWNGWSGNPRGILRLHAGGRVASEFGGKSNSKVSGARTPSVRTERTTAHHCGRPRTLLCAVMSPYHR
eukprot:947588-Rhodomonas_salina.5